MKMKKLKFNAVDLLILLVIVGAVIAVAYRGGLKDSLMALRSNDTIVYTVRINNLQESSFNLINIDDKLFADKDDKALGSIVQKEQRPAEKYVTLDTGEIVKTYMPGRIDVFLTVECKGRVTDEGCMLGGNYFIAAGKYISSYTKNLAFNFEITDAYKKQ
ncbi:MAG: DUF4330 domain-containing protein [Ruminococcaceae bacterium]|nr:DUF4330 domain-containing protein [Oscillospiraceae bacterium]